VLRDSTVFGDEYLRSVNEEKASDRNKTEIVKLETSRMTHEKKTIKTHGFDRVFNLVGGGGWFQWLLFGVCTLQVFFFENSELNLFKQKNQESMRRIGFLQAMFIYFHHVGYVFLGAVPEHWCEIDELRGTNWTREEIRNLSIPKTS